MEYSYEKFEEDINELVERVTKVQMPLTAKIAQTEFDQK
jgi:flagellar motor switch protein FliM